MSLGLVAYDNSDSDCSDVEEESHESTTNDKHSIFSSLPPPKALTGQITQEEAVESSHENLATPDTTKGKSKKQPVKIYLEPLSEFADKEEKTSKKLQYVPSSGSGLFSVLPPPKNTTGKVANRNLVPYSLTRPVAKAVPKPTIKKLKENLIQDEENDDEQNQDFFGLQKSKNDDKVEIPSTRIKLSETLASIPNLNPTVHDIQGPSLEMDVDQINHVSKAQNIEDLFQDQAFMRLRGKKRNIEEDSEIIDVSQDEQMPSWEERTKLLSQEDENAPVNKGPQPSAQHRRKHQITYLAYQAKARELELKNQWAQNKFTKAQTRAKYGF